jgi:putative acetyltransferase
MNIRAERAADISAIGAVTKAAFAPVAYSDQTEHLIVERLRKSGALSISLIAEEAGEVLGHIAFSPVSISSGALGCYGLGPLSVSPEHQAKGIGSKLVEAGLSALRALGASACVLAGDPAYYSRFGFERVEGLSTEGIPPDYFMALALRGSAPSGIVQFHPGFYGDN